MIRNNFLTHIQSCVLFICTVPFLNKLNLNMSGWKNLCYCCVLQSTPGSQAIAHRLNENEVTHIIDSRELMNTRLEVDSQT